MSTAILFASKHGTTEKVASQIATLLEDHKPIILNLKKNPMPDLSAYNTVLIGGSIYAGGIQKRITVLIKENAEVLLQKKIALFLCCMNEKEAENEFNTAYPDWLRSHSVSNKIIGGEYNLDKMNFIEKFLVRKISGTKTSISKIDQTKIVELVKDLNTKP